MTLHKAICTVCESRLTQDLPDSINSPADIGAHMNHLGALDHEEMWVLCLDKGNRIRSQVQLYRGTVDQCVVRPAELFREAIVRNLPAIVIIHNHPSGDPTPSPEDAAMTRRLAEAGKLLNIDVLDHVVIGHGRYVSMKERRLGFV